MDMVLYSLLKNALDKIKTQLNSKQDTLTSGENIKTINNQSILGEGNLDIESGSSATVDSELSDSSENPVQNKVLKAKFDVQTISIANKQDVLHGTGASQNIKTINNQDIMGSGNISIPVPTVDSAMSDSSENAVQNKVIKSYVDGKSEAIEEKIYPRYRGSFNSLTTLQQTSGQVGDFAFYSHTDTNGNTVLDRYKYIGYPEPKVPEEYTQLLALSRKNNEWWSYIDTGISISPTDTIYAKISVREAGGYSTAAFFGVKDNNGNGFYVQKNSIDGYRCVIINNGNNTYSNNIKGSGYHHEIEIELKNGKFYLNETDGGTAEIPNISSDYTLYLFDYNNAGQVGVDGYNIYWIYEFIVYDENGNKKLELIPCKKNSNNALYMYDTVSEEFLAPNGILDSVVMNLDPWELEYAIYNSSFTTAQWAAINSGVTSSNLTEKENISNKITLLSSSSTNTQYPSAKAVYDFITETGGETSIFSGKKASFYGDSITYVIGYNPFIKPYHSWCGEILDLATCNNYGIDSATVSDVYDKVNNTPDDADIIFIMCGVNEQATRTPLGQMGDPTLSTTYGRYDRLCNCLKIKYPVTPIVFLTPTYQTKFSPDHTSTSYEISKAMKEVAEKYSIPVYDCFVESGIHYSNLSSWTTDNCHWNAAAHEKVGKGLAKFVTTHIRYAPTPVVNDLNSISASYSNSNTVYTTDSLETLRPYITVTGTYEDNRTSRVDSYTLSGTLAEGSNTITITSNGKTATITVTAVAN